ncbi:MULTISPECIES: hypothetical protein [Vallitalea]|uniref:Uncharacterized protein n=1 Tax=Vallitalea maricola TaxID=3074433 RepID=A0ACB5UEB6_9FIRM|nr:hypothetical protein [Vallitalea guaymasensis]GMQ61202.1 hypothetical protein AN2V17_04300 [Vallitalea sp. AN17-2]
MDIQIKGKNYKLDYNLNALIDIQKRYGSMEEALKKLKVNNYEDIRFFLMIGINHGMDLELSEKDVGKLLNMDNISEVSINMMKAIS